MTGIDVDDITQGTVKYLLTVPAITALTGQVNPSTPWIFQDVIPQLVTVEGSQQSAIVISQRGGWAAPNEHNNMAFPRMAVDIFVDPLRDSANNVTDRAEARRRAYYIHKIVNKYLHIPSGFDMMWGDVRVISSVASNTFDVNPVPDGDGVLRGTTYYSVVVGN